MGALPRTAGPDSSLAFLREGYAFIGNRCDRFGSDCFRTRLMLAPVICMRGAEAARFFYDGGHFTRVGAMPRATLKLLQDVDSVQSLDGPQHRRRKQTFMAMMTEDQIARLINILRAAWHEAVPQWQSAERIVLYDALARLMTKTAAGWAGVPLDARDLPARAAELRAMVEQAAHVGPRNWWARAMRRRTERWCAETVRRFRRGKIEAVPESALALIARHEDEEGQPLSADVAGGETDGLEAFVQEVRRFYPFFPVIGGRAVEDLTWRGVHFPRGQWTLFDLYGTNHDVRLWPQPERFDPERFRGWQGDPYTLVPQGAGDYLDGHRCPGEWITIAVMKEAVLLLCRSMRYTVPQQRLEVSLSRVPALPRSGLLIQDIAALH